MVLVSLFQIGCKIEWKGYSLRLLAPNFSQNYLIEIIYLVLLVQNFLCNFLDLGHYFQNWPLGKKQCLDETNRHEVSLLSSPLQSKNSLPSPAISHQNVAPDSEEIGPFYPYLLELFHET
ncbi:Uncharacterised protein [Streptococcus pneumoniae]|nr:Uncharacterised protein [Streptococcus pneumoniae]